MGKQTELNKNKSSKKNYSFTGHRVIGENRATHVSNEYSDSGSDTTDDMRKILESDQPRNNQMNMMAQNNIAPQNFMMNQMHMMSQNPSMQQSANLMGNNQFNGLGDVDPLMVNTLAPVNNARNDFAGFDSAGLMNSTQMAQNMTGLANLAQLGSNNMNLANQYATNAMSETNMMGMNGMSNVNNIMGMNNINNMNNMNMMGMNSMGMNGMDMMGMNGMGMNGMGMMDKTLDSNGLKNLANLYSMNVIKK